MDVKEFEVFHGQYEKLKLGIKIDKIGCQGECNWDVHPTKDLLQEIIRKISGLKDKLDKTDKHYYRILAMEGALNYQHAKILVRLGKIEKAREILKYTTDSLKDYFLIPEITFLGLRVLNHYCYLLSKFGDMEKSQELLEFAESEYIKIKLEKQNKFYNNDDLFAPSPELTSTKEVSEKLERLVTNNLQMLGFVYSKQGKMDKFAVYHHQVLRRQLDMREGDATVWAMKTARLGYFFMTRNKFSQARHHLAAACYVLSQYENTLKKLETTDLVMAKWEELNHRYADIAKCWVKYGLFLFNASRLKSVSTFCKGSSTWIDSLWTNPLDKLIYGSKTEDEGNDMPWINETENNLSRGGGGGGLRTSEAVTDLKSSEMAKHSEYENFTGSTVSFGNGSDIFDVIFRNNNPSTISIGILPTELTQGLNRVEPPPSESDLGKRKKQDTEQDCDFLFPNLDLTCFENCVSCSYVDNKQAARDLFLFTHSWLKKSKLFYTIKDHPMEYVNVILDLSELYRYLAFYENDIENEYLLQKRRADTLDGLSGVLKELRPQCYVAISIELVRELAEVHLELMSLNLRRLYLAHSEATNQGGKYNVENLSDASEEASRKMKAVAEMHLLLNKLGDSLGHGALGDFEPVLSSRHGIQSGDDFQHNFDNLLDYYDNPDFKLNENMGSIDLAEKYEEVVNLLEDECRQDPKEEPYRSKYKAKTILLGIEEILIKNREMAGPEEPNYFIFSAMLSVVYLQIGIISLETEESSTGEEYLTKAYDMIPDHSDWKFIICSMNIRNQLGILWSERSESKKAQVWLEGAESLYENFNRNYPSESPATYREIFAGCKRGLENLGMKEIERVYTLTKFYLAQVYGSLQDVMKSAIYCHETLERQLVNDEYNPIDWALNSAKLSEFFMERILFRQARHHLAAASHVLANYETTLKDISGSDEEIECRTEEFNHRAADISRSWAKYGIFLLEFSKNNLNSSESVKESEAEYERLKDLWFSTLDLSKYEEEFPDSELVSYEDARQTFLVTQTHLNKAKEYYSLESHASSHAKIIQDHSQLFKHLMAFENEEEKQCKILKRRINLLEGLTKELNPQYYLLLCRQLWFELGDCYQDIMHIKLERFKKNSKHVHTPYSVKKINFLGEKSIENFTNFINSLKDGSSKQLPEVLGEFMKPTLIAHFYLGRLYYKMIPADKTNETSNLHKSLACFEYLVDYCEKNESAKVILGEELHLSKELISFLQLKMLQI